MAIYSSRDYRMVIIRKTADETIDDTITLQDDDELVLPVGANSVWWVTVLLYVIGKANADIKIAGSAPAGSSGVTITGATAFSASPLTTVITNPLVDDTLEANLIHYFLTNGANAGNFVPQWAQNVQQANDLTVKASSFLHALRIK